MKTNRFKWSHDKPTWEDRTKKLESTQCWNFGIIDSCSIFDPILVRPKSIWEVAVYLKNCKQRAEKPLKIEIFASFQTHFGFFKMGSKMYQFTSKDIYNAKSNRIERISNWFFI